MLNMDVQYSSEDGPDFGPTRQTTENSHKSRVRLKLKSRVMKSITYKQCIVTV